MIKLFMLGFIQLILVTLSSRITNRGQYVHQFCVSFVIGVVWVNIIHSITRADDIGSMFAYSLGSALGSIMGIWLHKRFFNTKKKSEDW